VSGKRDLVCLRKDVSINNIWWLVNECNIVIPLNKVLLCFVLPTLYHCDIVIAHNEDEPPKDWWSSVYSHDAKNDKCKEQGRWY